MTFLQKVTPINLQEEKARFFADPTYNPQFLYREAVPSDRLTAYGTPKKKYLELATEILEKTYFGRNEHDLYMLEGRLLKQAEAHQRIQTFLELHDLQNRYTTVWSSSFISRTTITSTTIKLRLPAEFRKEGLMGMLYHEVGTHALRRINYEQQPWFKRKKHYGFGEYLQTEEGLASLHSLLPHTFKSAYVSALRYLAVDCAQHHSFVEAWHLLKKYIQDPNRLWTTVFRQKRGLTDTAQPGGFTKDLVYFEGLIKVWQYLYSQNFSLSDLYYGKLALEDIAKAVHLNPEFEPVLPIFYTHHFESYKAGMLEIGEYNMLRQV